MGWNTSDCRNFIDLFCRDSALDPIADLALAFTNLLRNPFLGYVVFDNPIPENFRHSIIIENYVLLCQLN